jgi:hypothetical protein
MYAKPFSESLTSYLSKIGISLDTEENNKGGDKNEQK